MRDIPLSVVVIARNEEANIARCIESILRGVESLRAEIIFVDSASTDRTVEIASRYPITILQLDRRMDLSPSAGRFVGARHARGAFILFLDADMVLIEGWLASAMQTMTDPSFAAVGGRMFRVYPGEELTRDHPDTRPIGPIAALGGAALYRADALAASGGFNPFVKGEEERELGHRIAAQGYAILRIDVPMVYHMEKGRTGAEVDEKASHFQGVGQMLRAYSGSKAAVELLGAQSIRSALAFVAAMSFLCFLVLFSGNGVRAVIVSVGAAALLWLKIKGRLWKLPLAARFRILLLFNLFCGWMRGIPDPSTYKVSVSVVRRQTG